MPSVILMHIGVHGTSFPIFVCHREVSEVLGGLVTVAFLQSVNKRSEPLESSNEEGTWDLYIENGTDDVNTGVREEYFVKWARFVKTSRIMR